MKLITTLLLATLLAPAATRAVPAVSLRHAAPPAVPRDLLALAPALTDSTVTLLWDKPVQYRTIKAYAVYCDGRLVATTPRLNATVGRLQPGTTHTFVVRAQDAAGASSPATAAGRATTKAAGKVENILTYGAVGDGAQLNTKAIQRAIDACPAGGRVPFGAGAACWARP